MVLPGAFQTLLQGAKVLPRKAVVLIVFVFSAGRFQPCDLGCVEDHRVATSKYFVPKNAPTLLTEV